MNRIKYFVKDKYLEIYNLCIYDLWIYFSQFYIYIYIIYLKNELKIMKCIIKIDENFIKII